MKKLITGGKLMGIISFIFTLMVLLINYIIIILDIKVNIVYLYKIDLLSLWVFSTIWGSVFGSGIVKKLKNKESVNEKNSSNNCIM